MRALAMIGCFSLIMAGAVGAAGAAASNAIRPSKTAVIPWTIGTEPYNGDAGLQLAQDKGIYRHYGFNIALTDQEDDQVIIADMQSGQEHMGLLTLAVMLTADEEHAGVLCVAPVGPVTEPIKGYPQNAIVVAKNSPITSLKQLTGKTIGLATLKGANYATAKYALETAGVNFGSVQLAQVLFPDMVPAVNSGEITAAVVPSPYIEQGVAAGEIRVLDDLSSLNEGETTLCLATTQTYLASHRSLINRFVEAQDQGILFAKAHPAEANAEIPAVTGVSAADLKGTLPPKTSYSDNLGPVGIVDYETWIQKYVGLGGPVIGIKKLAYIAPGTPMTKLLFNNKGKYLGG